MDKYLQIDNLLVELGEVNSMIDTIEDQDAYSAINDFSGGYLTYKAAVLMLRECEYGTSYLGLLEEVNDTYHKFWNEEDQSIYELLATYNQGDITLREARELLSELMLK